MHSDIQDYLRVLGLNPDFAKEISHEDTADYLIDKIHNKRLGESGAMMLIGDSTLYMYVDKPYRPVTVCNILVKKVELGQTRFTNSSIGDIFEFPRLTEPRSSGYIPHANYFDLTCKRGGGQITIQRDPTLKNYFIPEIN